MARPEKPHTQKEMIDQLWFAVIGANSEGIAERVKRIDDRLIEVERSIPDFMTHAEHREYVDGCRAYETEERRRKWRSTDVVMSVLMLIVTAVSVIGIFV